MVVFLIILGVLCAFVTVLLIRAARFQPAAQEQVEPAATAVDEAGALAHMQAMIRVKTVSYRDKTLEDDSQFEAFVNLLPTLYPALHEALTLERVGSRGLLYRWAGKGRENPSVFMAHYDVVPAQEDAWEKPPFEGIVEKGLLWGRGTLDTKGTLLGILEAAEALVKQGFQPEQDVYLSFGGDEETRGGGTPGIVALLRSRGIKPAFVLDEGGAVVEKVFPGVSRPCAMIGIGEKGSMDVRLSAKSPGGHASTPPRHTAVGLLAKAVTRIDKAPFPFRLTPPALRMFDTLGRHASFPLRVVFANLWCFKPLLNLVCRMAGGELNALTRTTCAFTQMQGSDAPNVLPPEAFVGANLRLLGGDTVESAKARLAKTAGNQAITVEVIRGNDPSPVSLAEGEPWQRLCRGISAVWPEAIQSPYLMMAASDACHYTAISDHVYRFSAMALSSEERKLIHGHNERVPVETLYKTIRFYQQIMGMC